MSKQLRFMVLDTETATLPLCEEIAKNAEEKKKLAIAKPLIYDFAYIITNRKGEIIKQVEFLVAEIFSVPSIFNTAYYRDKRPIYLEKLKQGKTMVKPWNEIIEIFLADIETVDAVGAFNSMFDFKKAIPFTEKYIEMLYSSSYQEWENEQRKSCERIITNYRNKSNNFNSETFSFRGKDYPLFDLWGLSVEYLLNNVSYKRKCIEHNLLTASGLYFRTSAESSYRYICDKFDFEESHTALEDAIIETILLTKIAKHHAINIGIDFFPFKKLGDTIDFVTRTKKPKVEDCRIVIDAIVNYIETKDTESRYINELINRIQRLSDYAGIDCPI